MRKIVVVAVFITLILSLFALGCSDDRKFVNIALKTGQKVYLLPSIADKVVLEHQLSKDLTPSISKSVAIVEDDGDFFVEPRDFERILNLIADNYIIYGEKEQTHDGYVAFGESEVYSYAINPVNTDKIGQQLNQGSIRITNGTSDKSLEIVWVDFPEPRAVANCTVKKIWVVTSPYQGTTIGNYEDTVMINLGDIIEFYDNGTRLEYVEDEEMLYVVK